MRIRLIATLARILGALFAPLCTAEAANNDSTNLNEAPASPDPYTTDSSTGPTDPNDPSVTVASTDESVAEDDNPPIWSQGHQGVAPTTTQGCKQITGKITTKNVMGDTIYTFQQTAVWCWSSGSITYKYSDYNVSSPGQFWEFKGLVDSQSSSGTTSPWIRYREGYFAQCFPNWLGGGCYHKSYPWLRFYMYANGGYSITHS